MTRAAVVWLQFRGRMPVRASDRLHARSQVTPAQLPSAVVVPCTKVWLESNTPAQFRHESYLHREGEGDDADDGDAAAEASPPAASQDAYRARRFARLVAPKTSCALECDAHVDDIANVLEAPIPTPQRASRAVISLEGLWEV